MAKAKVPTEKMTYEEFLKWCDEDTWAEWVDGEVIVLTPAPRRHQQLVAFLMRVLGAFVEQQGLGVVLSAPFQMKTGPELPGREPDILFIAEDHLGRLKETHLEGPADLVIEITSPESLLRDRGEKFAEYELGGVREYWLIDPEEQRVDLYVLGPEGRYERQRADERGIFRSQALQGFSLKAGWLWQEPLPPVPEVLRELGLG